MLYGMPPHRSKLKPGAVVVLPSNVDFNYNLEFDRRNDVRYVLFKLCRTINFIYIIGVEEQIHIYWPLRGFDSKSSHLAKYPSTYVDLRHSGHNCMVSTSQRTAIAGLRPVQLGKDYIVVRLYLGKLGEKRRAWKRRRGATVVACITVISSN